jgi:hypothetical protein
MFMLAACKALPWTRSWRMGFGAATRVLALNVELLNLPKPTRTGSPTRPGPAPARNAPHRRLAGPEGWLGEHPRTRLASHPLSADTRDPLATSLGALSLQSGWISLRLMARVT